MVADCFSPLAWFGRVSARRPTHFLLLRQKKVSKEKASRSPGRCAVPCAARSERGRAELAFGSNNAHPDPLAPALLSPATRRAIGFGNGLPVCLPLPLGEGRGEGNASHAAEECTSVSVSASVSAPRRHALASSAGPGGNRAAHVRRPRSGQVCAGPAWTEQRSVPAAQRRDSASGSPFLCLLSFGEAKESKAPAGARPGQTKLPENTR